MIPDKIPILRMEDDHTHYLGACADGRLFWGYETFAFTKPPHELTPDNWQQYRKEYAILHTFDMHGNFLNSEFWVAGLTSEIEPQSVTEKLEKMIAGLGSIAYRDIEVCLFNTVIDNITFGLMYNEEIGSVDLQPGAMISFQEPWDGEYFT